MSDGVASEGLSGAAMRELSGIDHAAIMLLLVGDDEAADLLRRLDAEEIKALGRAMLDLGEVNEPDVEGVIDRFVDGVRRQNLPLLDAKPRVRSVMNAALGGERAGSVLAKIAPPDRLDLLPSLAWMEPADIAQAIAIENSQVQAIVVSQLAPNVAAEVLGMLPAEILPDLLRRVAYLAPVSAAAFEDVEALLASHVRSRSIEPTGAQDGIANVARIVNALPSGLAKSIAVTMRRVDKKLAGEIEDALFVFDDLAKLDDRNLGILARSLPPELIVDAFRSGNAALLDRVLGAMSRRAADSLRDQMAEATRIPREQMVAAQGEIVAIARSLVDRGELILGGDDYV